MSELDEATRIALEATPDGRDLRDEAWHRLIAEAAAWSLDPQAFAATTVVRPRWSEVLADPDRFRGLLLETEGRLEQSAPVRTPGIADDAVLEWFVRTDTATGPNRARAEHQGGGVVQVFVPAAAAASVSTGRSVRVVGRLLRRTELEGRDGVTRSFATIVGVPLVTGSAASTWPPGATIALATLLLLPLAVFLRRAARRAPGTGPRLESPDAAAAVDPREDLPSDPCEALGVLAAEAKHDTR